MHSGVDPRQAHVTASHLQVQVLGLLAVLALPDAELPPEVAAGSHDILAAIVKLLSAYRDQQVHTALLVCLQ